MIKTIIAKVKKVLYRDDNITRFETESGGKIFDCISHNQLTGKVDSEDTVLLNTTAVELGLGSGGCHFVIANLSRGGVSNIGEGHIMKLRYTPMQINCMASEAQESPYHEVFNSFDSLYGMPVIIGTLHSMVVPIALTLRKLAKEARISYIMTDGGALPLWMSNAVRSLVKDEMINGTITYGNAFGGDLECINVYTALIAAKEIFEADVAIVCMGPGIAGTDTRYGFSGAEQSQIIDAVNVLGGKAIAVPRISFADIRSRHYGLSHHTRMTLGKLCCTSAFVALPELEKPKADLIREQLLGSGIIHRHALSYWNTESVAELLQKEEGRLEIMGRSYRQDKEYFITCGISAFLAV